MPLDVDRKSIRRNNQVKPIPKLLKPHPTKDSDNRDSGVTSAIYLFIRQKKAKEGLGNDLLSQGLPPSTISAGELNCRVRYGSGVPSPL